MYFPFISIESPSDCGRTTPSVLFDRFAKYTILLAPCPSLLIQVNAPSSNGFISIFIYIILSIRVHIKEIVVNVTPCLVYDVIIGDDSEIRDLVSFVSLRSKPRIERYYLVIAYSQYQS